MIYARKGERVTCLNGHAICEFSQDVDTGHFFNPKHLIGWTQPEPASGDPISGIKCVQCGAKFMSEDNVFHFANGWRTFHAVMNPKKNDNQPIAGKSPYGSIT